MANIEKATQKDVKHSGAEQLIDTANALSPDVDVFISDDGLLFKVDLPGVSEESGSIKVEIDEENTLIVRAENGHKEPGEISVKQFRIGDYYRAFKLSKEYDKNKASIEYKDGVLTINVPKKEDAKPHKIELSN